MTGYQIQKRGRPAGPAGGFGTDQGWQALARAIVVQAAEDYRRERRNGASRRILTAGMKELLDFFYGRWFSQLCALDPDWLLDKLEKSMWEETTNDLD